MRSKKKQKPMKNLDDACAQLGEAMALVMQDAKHIPKSKAVGKEAAKLLKSVNLKLKEWKRTGVEPDLTEFGQFKGKPIPKSRQHRPVSK